MVERQAENLAAVGSIPTRGILLPYAGNPNKVSKLIFGPTKAPSKKTCDPFQPQGRGEVLQVQAPKAPLAAPHWLGWPLGLGKLLCGGVGLRPTLPLRLQQHAALGRLPLEGRFQ